MLLLAGEVDVGVGLSTEGADRLRVGHDLDMRGSGVVPFFRLLGFPCELSKNEVSSPSTYCR